MHRQHIKILTLIFLHLLHKTLIKELFFLSCDLFLVSQNLCKVQIQLSIVTYLGSYSKKAMNNLKLHLLSLEGIPRTKC